jgi:prevent-host-death family protein
MRAGRHHTISVSDAKSQLTELVRRAEAGEDVVLTRHGRAVVRLVPVTAMPTAIDRRAVLEKVRASGPKSATPGPDAALSQDFLYDEDGLPR